MSGVGGYHTYRIPTLAVMPNGTLLVFAEGRKTSAADNGDIDLVMRRSSDGGQTWSGMQVVHEEGGTAPITIGNPTPIVDRTNGQLHLLFSRNNERLFVTTSGDDGVTFSTPTEITSVAENFNFDWTRLGPGPTAGIQMTSGRLVAPIWLNNVLGDPDTYRSGALVSDDHGQSWQAGQVVPINADPTIRGTNECAVVQLANGSLMMTERTSAGTPSRAKSTSTDGGITWTAAARDSTINSQMTTVKTSIARYSLASEGGTNRLLYSAPGAADRSHMTVWLSENESATWPTQREVYSGPSGYSELGVMADKTVLLAYENGTSSYNERITLARFNLDWLQQSTFGNAITNGDFEDTFGWGDVGTTDFPAGWMANDQRKNAAAMQQGANAMGGEGCSAFMPAFFTSDETQRREIRQSTNTAALGPQWRLSFRFATEDPGAGSGRSLSLGISHGDGQIVLRVVDTDNNGEGEIQLYDGDWQSIGSLYNVVSFDNDVSQTPEVNRMTIAGHYDTTSPTYDITLVDAVGNVHRAVGLTGWLSAAPSAGALPSAINFNTFLSSSDYLIDDLVLLGRDVWVPGDTDGDGNVDATDASTLAEHWGNTNATWATGDFNDDGLVNAYDASILAAHWNQGLEQASNVPEPVGAVLILIGLPSFIWKMTGR
ncbi:MAG: exo-alpha-sialidase [Pirellulales bacterium]|nr:exo-alpha-sialidase [Pirellulales bacterium]